LPVVAHRLPVATYVAPGWYGWYNTCAVRIPLCCAHWPGPSLPEWAAMPDDELLQRIPFIAASAANIEAGLRDRVHELRDRGVSWARIGAALGMTRQSACERFSHPT
jgi:hypothetical protein